jgi:arylsulfatase A-like enzyme
MPATIMGFIGLGLATSSLFLWQLLHIPGSIVASFNYRISRLYPVWDLLSPDLIALYEFTVWFLLLAPGVFISIYCLARWKNLRAVNLLAVTVIAGLILAGATFHTEPPASRLSRYNTSLPNIIMIGSDTLRGDRLDPNYPRNITPNIKKLSDNAVQFLHCYVPQARTAASIASILTGTWPHDHNIRSNYVPDHETVLPVTSLPDILSSNGYHTAVIGDWAASDLGKLQFGFEDIDTGSDQWNIKYLIRQGPKDLRFFLTLFTHNRFGKYFLPELYYLAGVPMTDLIGLATRNKLYELARNRRPFFLTVFFSTTHGPFGSTYPYYSKYRHPDYMGESRFAMSGLSTVKDIISKQEADKGTFDIDQIINLYDGAVENFDNELSKIIDYIASIGILDNSIIVIFSDHGVDLFEKETWGQGNILSEASHRVPLIFYSTSFPSGQIISTPVRSIDIAPSLLALAGIQKSSSMSGESLFLTEDRLPIKPAQASFMETGVWLGKVRGLPSDRMVYPSILEILEIKDETTGTLSLKPQFHDVVIEAKARMVINDGWGLSYLPLKSSAEFALYDLKKDPDRNVDVSDIHPEIAEKLKSTLVDWMLQDKSLRWEHDHLLPERNSVTSDITTLQYMKIN